jgi:hypothetical protein
VGWLGAVVVIAIRLLYIEASLGHAKASHGALVFRASWSMQMLLGGMIVGFSVVIINGLGREAWWVLSGLGLFVLLGLFVWPAAIAVTDTGVEQHTWWRPARSIPWDEVSGIEKSSYGEVQVFGRSGQCINFSRYHVEPWRFQNEVMRRARLQGVLDASAPPSLRT